jgi:hypothetical protein
MRLRTRLEKLERQVGPLGCPACRERRGRHVLLTVKELPDGTLLPSPDQPPPCARCGQVAELVIQVVAPVEADAGEDHGPGGEGGPALEEPAASHNGGQRR